MSNTDTRTIDITPHWPGVRRWAVAAYRGGDIDAANAIVAAMGSEAPREWPPTADTDPEAGRWAA